MYMTADPDGTGANLQPVNRTTIVVPGPCDANPFLNGGTCTATGSNFSCSCPAAFMGNTCETPNPCSPNPCQNIGTCNVNGTSFTCTCAAGFEGTTCDTATEPEATPCSNYHHRHNDNRSVRHWIRIDGNRLRARSNRCSN
eukprot:UN06046